MKTWFQLVDAAQRRGYEVRQIAGATVVAPRGGVPIIRYEDGTCLRLDVRLDLARRLTIAEARALLRL